MIRNFMFIVIITIMLIIITFIVLYRWSVKIIIVTNVITEMTIKIEFLMIILLYNIIIVENINTFF